MKMLALSLLAVVSFQAHADIPAQRVSSHKEFMIRSTSATGWTYYNCDSVENTVTDMLEKLGAKNVSVRCTGGIDDFHPPMDAYVDVTFDALKLADSAANDTVMADWAVVKFNSWDNCELQSQILANTKDGFSITDMKVSSCSGPSSQFNASLKTLF